MLKLEKDYISSEDYRKWLDDRWSLAIMFNSRGGLKILTTFTTKVEIMIVKHCYLNKFNHTPKVYFVCFLKRRGGLKQSRY